MLYKDSAAYQLLEMIALVGEFPTDALTQLFGVGSYKEKVAQTLKAERLIKLYQRDGLRSYRLARAGKVMLLADNPERYDLLNHRRSKSELTRRLRLHRLTEVYIALQQTGVFIFRDHKDDIFYLAEQTEQQTQEQIGTILSTVPAFYDSMEVKAYGIAATKIKNARFCGVVLAEQDIFITYNTGDSALKWERKSELRTKALIQHIVGRDRLPMQYAGASIRGLMFGRGMEMAKELMTGMGHKKAGYFRLDDTYDHFHYIPLNHDGEAMLQFMLFPQLKQNLDTILIGDLTPAQGVQNMELDAYDGDGHPVLFAWDFDMKRVENFLWSLENFGKMGIIYCFDFQRQVLEEYAGDRVHVRSIDTQKLFNRL